MWESQTKRLTAKLGKKVESFISLVLSHLFHVFAIAGTVSRFKNLRLFNWLDYPYQISIFSPLFF
jgi:hypothetical protein